MSVTLPSTRRWRAFREDVAKAPAFLRRDLISLFSYRIAYVTDWINIVVQVFLFYFVSMLVPPDRLPSYGGQPVTYLEYVAVALTLTSFVQAGLGRLIAAIRNEQLMGTLESLMVAPMSPEILQLGSMVYDLIYVPLRTAIFLILVSILFGVEFNVAGLVPTGVIFVFFMPFMWGLGILSAAAVLTFRRGAGVVGIVGTVLTFTSGAYFPVEYLPEWLQGVAEWNPITVAVEASRQALLGTITWAAVGEAVALIIPFSIASLAAGIVAFRLAMRRERRRGTMSLY
jgi:ABC-2 type transport system permease protein